jgi:hypothetical protein
MTFSSTIANSKGDDITPSTAAGVDLRTNPLASSDDAHAGAAPSGATLQVYLTSGPTAMSPSMTVEVGRATNPLTFEDTTRTTPRSTMHLVSESPAQRPNKWYYCCLAWLNRARVAPAPVGTPDTPAASDKYKTPEGTP